LAACGTVKKSSEKSPAPEPKASSGNGPTEVPEAARANYPYGDLIEHAQLPNGTFVKVCETSSDGAACPTYKLVKAYYPTAEDKAAAEVGPTKRICEQPQGASDQNCNLFRLEKSGT
jgi:hypothetical protein